MSISITALTPDRAQTDQTDLAAYVTAVHGFGLLRIVGPPYKRRFVFDREITPEISTRFYSSSEKRCLDQFRSLKSALMTQ
jgi:hypothetical protein